MRNRSIKGIRLDDYFISNKEEEKAIEEIKVEIKPIKPPAHEEVEKTEYERRLIDSPLTSW